MSKNVIDFYVFLKKFTESPEKFDENLLRHNLSDMSEKTCLGEESAGLGEAGHQAANMQQAAVM